MEELEDDASLFHFYKSMENHLEECFGPVEDFFRNGSNETSATIRMTQMEYLSDSLTTSIHISGHFSAICSSLSQASNILF
jgi:hypothetical protein